MATDLIDVKNDKSKLGNKRNLVISIVIIVGLLSTLAMYYTTSSAGAGGTRKVSANANPNCEMRVMVMLDRSSSVAWPQYGGESGNVDFIKEATNELVKKLQGNLSFINIQAFGTVPVPLAMNETTEWYPLRTSSNISTVVTRVNQLKYKNSSANTYNDGINGAGEGLTNWESSLFVALRTKKKPTHVLMFTDGNPTVREGHMVAAQNAGGSFNAAGLSNVDGDSDGNDLSLALKASQDLRKQGVKVIPVGVGNVNESNLQSLAGWKFWGVRNESYYADSYKKLVKVFSDAITKMQEDCEVPPCAPADQPPCIQTTPERKVTPILTLEANPGEATVTEGGSQDISLRAQNKSLGGISLKDVTITYHLGAYTCPRDYGSIDDDTVQYQGGSGRLLAPEAFTSPVVVNVDVPFGISNTQITYTVCGISRANLGEGDVSTTGTDIAYASRTFTVNVDRKNLPS